MNDPDKTDAGHRPEETPEQREYRIRTHADNYWTLRNILIVATTVTSAAGLVVSLSSLFVALSFANKQGTFREQDLVRQEHLRQLDQETEKEMREKDFERARLLKEIDIRQYCQKRYDDLAYDAKVRVKSNEDAKGYYKRFWDLQFEQYQYCIDGVIEEAIFETWMASRRREFDENEPVGRMRYKKGWDYMAEHFIKNDHGKKGAYTEFVAFMNEVFAGTKTTCDPKPKTP